MSVRLAAAAQHAARLGFLHDFYKDVRWVDGGVRGRGSVAWTRGGRYSQSLSGGTIEAVRGRFQSYDARRAR